MRVGRSRLPRAVRHRFGTAFIGVLALTSPVWIEGLVATEPLARPIAEILEREEPGRVAPESAEQELRRRLQAPAPAPAAPARRLHSLEESSMPLDPVEPPLPRAFDPNAPLGQGV